MRLVVTLQPGEQGLGEIRPMCSTCCDTVVIGGSWRAAAGMSSNPTTETSSGTRFPASRNARIAPMAMMSLATNTASSSGTRLSSLCHALVA